MKEIKLERSNWFYKEANPLGKKGGFGQVFLGKSSDDKEVAVKRLYIKAEEADHRELSLAKELSLRENNHVINIYDSGIDAESGSYFIVMAKADYSLQEVIDNDKLSEDESIEILHQIALGLSETKDIVHRDLKPDNVLFENDKWQIADFGIAKFIEDTTSINTLKECLTPYYAAPEQWQYESTTKATDIYAFGCIAYTLISGQPPFTDSDPSQLRDKHLNIEPPKLEVSPHLQQLISLSLRKSPESRPSIDSALKQLENIKKKPQKMSSIAKAGSKIAEKEAVQEAERIKTQTEEEKRKQLAKDAYKNLRLILNQLFHFIKEQAPVAKTFGKTIQLGSGEIKISESFMYIPTGSFPNSKLDIVCGAVIEVNQKYVRYQGRASNLWYMKRGENYRWYEVAYWTLGKQSKRHNPFAIENDNELRDADLASAKIMHSVNHAFNPKIIDGEYSNEFVERWANRLAAAADNNLQRPSRLPED